MNKITICSHDAGGAEILSSYVRRNHLDCFYCISGPAKNIFKQKISDIQTSDLDQSINSSKIFIGSLGWSQYEWDGLLKANQNQLKSIIFLDHWTKYAERFSRNGTTVLPDEIWVGDEYAYNLAVKLFPNIQCKLMPNPYWLDIEDQLTNKQDKPIDLNALKILYIMEPTDRKELQGKYEKYSSGDALQYFLERMCKIKKNINLITVRPHPSQNISDYLNQLNSIDLPIQVGGTDNLISEICNADWVVGQQSMALIIALKCRKKVFRSVPPVEYVTFGPFSKITSIEDEISSII